MKLLRILLQAVAVALLASIYRKVRDMANTDIRIEAVTGSRKEIKVELVGVAYTIRPPKAAFGLHLARVNQNDQGAMAGLVIKWIEQAFGDESDAVLARMDDYDDELDLTHLMELMQLVMERVSGNPTTSPSDS